MLRANLAEERGRGLLKGLGCVQIRERRRNGVCGAGEDASGAADRLLSVTEVQVGGHSICTAPLPTLMTPLMAPRRPLITVPPDTRLTTPSTQLAHNSPHLH